jgi:hypothetical protein
MRASRGLVAIAVATLLTAVPWSRAGAADPDPVYPVAQFADLLAGAMQASAVPGADRTRPFGANPAFMPDWDHDGVFGDAGDDAIENSTRPGTTLFRYPCIALSGEVTYRTVSGGCVAGDRSAPFLTGEATRLRVVDEFGYELTATLFVPGEARTAPGRRLPGAVIADGAQASMQTFSMYAMTLAEQGIVVLSFDVAGRGQSEDGAPVVRNVSGPPSPTRGAHDPAHNGSVDSTDGPTGTRAYYDELRHQGRGDGALEQADDPARFASAVLGRPAYDCVR